jgi:uncharacterized protein YuzE
MKHRYLEVTYRKGKPLAAYLYLPRDPSAKAVRNEDAGGGMRVDYDSLGTPIGIEITAPTSVTLDAIGAVLERVGQLRLMPDEWAPLRAA